MFNSKSLKNIIRRTGSNKQTDRHTDWQLDRIPDWHIDWQLDRIPDRHTDGQLDRIPDNTKIEIQTSTNTWQTQTDRQSVTAVFRLLMRLQHDSQVQAFQVQQTDRREEVIFCSFYNIQCSLIKHLF